MGILVTSCEKKITTEQPQANEMLEKFYNTDFSDIVDEFNMKKLSQEDISFIEAEKTNNDDIGQRGYCCDVGSIVNLAGGTNEFKIPIEFYDSSGYIITVWQGTNVQWSGYNSIPLTGCLNGYLLTDLDNFANIQSGQSYTLRFLLYDGSGPPCDIGSKSFIGE